MRPTHCCWARRTAEQGNARALLENRPLHCAPWLEETWQDNEEVREGITEAEWEEFIEGVESAVE
jgi:hypothetical protein